MFHTRSKKVYLQGLNIQFDWNELNTTVYDHNLTLNLERIYDNRPDPKMRWFKLLGVFVDETLTFKKHASSLCAKLARSIFCKKRVAHLVSMKSLRSLYFALVYSLLLYCPIILNCMSRTNIHYISRLKRKTFRVMKKSTYNSPTEPLFYSCKILPFEKLISQCNCVSLLFMHSIEYNYAP